jgi:hypothetical protein
VGENTGMFNKWKSVIWVPPVGKLLLLALSIFFMAGVYELQWVVRPDYFRVQSGVNFLPLDLAEIARAYSAYSDSKPLPDLLRQRGDDTASKRIEDIYQKFRLASISLVNKKSELSRRSEQDTREYKSFEKDRFAQYDAFVAQKAAPFAGQKKAIEDRMQMILTTAGVQFPDSLPLGPGNAYYALNVDRAKAELREVQAKVEAMDYGLKHLDEFMGLPSQQVYLAHAKELADLQRSISEELEETGKLHGQLYDAFLAYRDGAASQLGYWDFLYFSVGAATTATFGDISPNSTRVRLLVCLQVLGSIVITGLIINGLASPKSKDRTTPGPDEPATH